MRGVQMEREMSEQPDVLARLTDRFDADVASVRSIRPASFAGTVWVGRGSSDNAAQLGRYLGEELSGRPAGLAAVSLHTRSHAEIDYTGYLAAVFSQSGRTPEIVTAAAAIRAGGGRVVAITNEWSSPLAEVADLVLPLGAGPEQAVPATKTVTAQLLLAAAVATGLGSAPTLTSATLAGLPGDVGRSLAEPELDLARRWQGYGALLVTGRGIGYAAAAEIALKVRETTGVFAQALSTADLLHGPIAAVGPEVAVLVIGASGSLQDDVLEVARRAGQAGAAVELWPVAVDDSGPTAAVRSAIVATVRGQVLALAWARARGVDPDRPAGLHKVTLTY